jgi:hypothetical protein
LAGFDAEPNAAMQKWGAGNLDNRSYMLKKYTVCCRSIHFLGPKIRQKCRSFTAKSQIIQRCHTITPTVQRGMVLAIPLTQAAVGPFAAF